jgi:hypothetical protein
MGWAVPARGNSRLCLIINKADGDVHTGQPITGTGRTGHNVRDILRAQASEDALDPFLRGNISNR